MDELKKIKRICIKKYHLNLKNKIFINIMIFWKGINIIFNSLKLKIFRRIENFKLLFWENKAFFSIFNLDKRLFSKELIFFELYNFLVGLNDWESGIKSGVCPNFYLKSIIKNFGQKFIILKNTRRIDSIKIQSLVKKNSLILGFNPIFII